MNNFFEKLKNSKYALKIISSVVLGTAAAFLMFYFFLPPLNVRSVGFWFYIFAVTVFYSLPFLGIKVQRLCSVRQNKNGHKEKIDKYDVDINKLALIAPAIPVAVIIVGLIFSSTLFNSRKYAGIITVTESNFSDDMPESSEITNIALMDTESAIQKGARALGSLADMVSQYDLTSTYTQINYMGAPKKVTPLEYDGFFKWISNRASGVPGMVMVDPVDHQKEAEYIAFSSPIRYVESGYFGDDLERKLRFDYPTKIFNSISFEIDENGKPYYIVACSTPKVFLFGAPDISEVIIFDPANGDSEIMPIGNVPSWVDIVYMGDLATEKYDWHGMLSGGFINSIIGNKNCKRSTDDFGYIALDDDVWYFTGVTSAVGNDKSNIGFILSNARTGEYKFYPVIGAEEHSAMEAAQGEVQEKGYVASFPSLVNVGGQATYIMVLKDNSGIVKLYALVNVENYGTVATGKDQAEAMTEYKRLLGLKDDGTAGGTETVDSDIVVTDVRIVNVGGKALVYITALDGKVYKGNLESDESLILIRIGDAITVTNSETQTEGIYLISSWKKTTP